MTQLTFNRGGVHPPEHKELSSQKPIMALPLPAEVVVHMNQHLGRPAKPQVNPKDQVKVGDLLGQAEGMISAVVHSPVSGVVKKIERRLSASGAQETAVVIEVNAEQTLEDDKAYQQKCAIDFDAMTPEALLAAVKAAGIVGKGGATFPTHVKLTPPADKQVDTLLLNGAECEPFLTADHQLMLEQPDAVLLGARVFQKILNVASVIIGIEENKPDAIQRLQERIQTLKLSGFSVAAVKTRYPQGGEKQLIWAVLGREVPSGKLPFEVGVVVQNIATAFAAYEAVWFGKPVFERVVTVSGFVKTPGNFRMRMGTSFQDAIAAAGGFIDESKVRSVIHGGPMMGKSIRELDVTVMKGTSGIVVMSEHDFFYEKEGPCIRCGRCIAVCPMGLMPTELAVSAQFDQAEQLTDSLDCMECGCCSYICPTRRKLVHWIRIGKSLHRHHQRSKA